MKSLLVTTAALLTLTACASSSNYQEARSEQSDGYSEQVIEANRYRIQYRLDEDHVGKAQDYAMLRAAELTMENGFETFEVVGRSSDVSSETETSPNIETTYNRTITRDCGLLGCATSSSPAFGTEIRSGTTRTDQETVVTLEIVLSDDDASMRSSHYDASEVAANVRSRQ